MKVKSESEVIQSCLTLLDPMDCSPLGSSVHGRFQARVLEWGAIAFSMEFPEERWLIPQCLIPHSLEKVALASGKKWPQTYVQFAYFVFPYTQSTQSVMINAKLSYVTT